jgi:predicted nucleotidyltransferase
MSVSPIDIEAEGWAIVRDILRRHVPDHAVWAFGSRAKRTARRFSDLDLAIITDTPLPLDLAIITDTPLPLDVGRGLREDFSTSDLPSRVDILDWATASEAFRRRVEQDKVVIQAAGRR